MFFRWFDARAAEEFGLELAELFAEKYSSNLKKSGAKVATKQLKLTRETYTKAQQFHVARRLNVYQKAKMGNAFKWKLKEMGYETEFIDALTKDLMVALR